MQANAIAALCSKTLNFDLYLTDFGYELTAGTYIVHAAIDASLDDSSSTRIVVLP